MATIKGRVYEKSVKEALLSQMKNKIDLNEAVEWLYEDFGIKVKGSWENLMRAVLNNSEITPNDVAVFMIEQGVDVDEGAWSVLPATRLRGNRPNNKHNKT
jgi:hypothetical protein